MVLTCIIIWRHFIAFDMFPFFYADNTVVFGTDENEFWLATIFEFQRMSLNYDTIKIKFWSTHDQHFDINLGRYL